MDLYKKNSFFKSYNSASFARSILWEIHFPTLADKLLTPETELTMYLPVENSPTYFLNQNEEQDNDCLKEVYLKMSRLNELVKEFKMLIEKLQSDNEEHFPEENP